MVVWEALGEEKVERLISRPCAVEIIVIGKKHFPPGILFLFKTRHKKF